MTTKKKITKPRPRKEKIVEVFAYLNDDTGLPLPVPSFSPVPQSLLDHTRFELRKAIMKRGHSSNEIEISRVVEWSLNPTNAEARAFRRCLRNPYSDELLKCLSYEVGKEESYNVE